MNTYVLGKLAAAFQVALSLLLVKKKTGILGEE